MKLFKIGIYFLALSCVFTSCRGPRDPAPLTIVGKWEIQKVDASISEISAASRNSTQNVSGNGLFIQFYSSLTFATNTDISLTKLQVNQGSTFTGEYAYVVENGKDNLVLSFFDPELQEEVALSFEIVDMDTNNPILYMNKDNYIESLRESAKEMESSIGTALINFSYRINEASFTLTCQKTN